VGARLARDIGVDRITVEIDYPHSDTTWPRAPEKLMGEFEAAALTDAEINAMTHENAMRFFRYDPFAHRPRERCTVSALRAEATGVDTTPVAKGRRVESRPGVTISELSPTA
jgi:hypothetical protein